MPLLTIAKFQADLAHYKRRATYYVFGARSWESFSASVSCLQIKIKIKIKININILTQVY